MTTGSVPGGDPYAGHVLPTAGTSAPWWVAMCMVATLDGAATVDGRSHGLGGEADTRALVNLRAAADVVLVGAGTVRAEGYGPLRVAAARREMRTRAGLAPTPRLAIVTASGDLAPDAAVFSSPAHRPLLVTTERARAGVTDRLGDVADVLVCGTDTVEPPVALRELAALDLPRVLVEGGPTLNAQLIAHDLVDEAFVTLAPWLVGGEAPRIAQGVPSPAARGLELVGAVPADGDLLLHYRRRTAG